MELHEVRAQSLSSFLLRGPPCLARIPPAAARQEMANGHGLSGKLATPLEELDMRTDTFVKPISSMSFFNASVGQSLTNEPVASEV